MGELYTVERICGVCGHEASGSDAKSVEATHVRHTAKKHPAPEPKPETKTK